MSDLIEKACSARRETKQIEFKCRFDPASNGEWCEVIKDIVAIANSGGGIVVFGVNDDGSLSGLALDAISRIDPADLSVRSRNTPGALIRWSRFRI
jgi:predicted HTH transcriptional regulator